MTSTQPRNPTEPSRQGGPPHRPVPASSNSKTQPKPMNYGDYYNQGQDEVISPEVKAPIKDVKNYQQTNQTATAPAKNPGSEKIAQTSNRQKDLAKPHSHSVKDSPENLAKSATVFEPQQKKSKLRSENFSLSERKIAVTQNKIPGVGSSENESILSEQEEYNQPTKNTGDQSSTQKDGQRQKPLVDPTANKKSQPKTSDKSSKQIGAEELVLCEYDYLKEIFEFMPRPRLLVSPDEAAAIPKEDSDEMKNLVMAVKRISCKSELESAVSASLISLIILVIFYLTAMICIAVYSFSSESLISDIIILLLISGTCIFLRKRAVSGVQIMSRLEMKSINTLVGHWNKAKYNLFGLNYAYVEEEGMEESAFLKLSYSESFKKRTRPREEPKVNLDQPSKTEQLKKDPEKPDLIDIEQMTKPELQNTIAVHNLEDMAHQNSLNQASTEYQTVQQSDGVDSTNITMTQPVYDDQVGTQQYYSDLPPVEEYSHEGGYYHENQVADEDYNPQNQVYPEYDQGQPDYNRQYEQPYDNNYQQPYDNNYQQPYDDQQPYQQPYDEPYSQQPFEQQQHPETYQQQAFDTQQPQHYDPQAPAPSLVSRSAGLPLPRSEEGLSSQQQPKHDRPKHQLRLFADLSAEPKAAVGKASISKITTYDTKVIKRSDLAHSLPIQPLKLSNMETVDERSSTLRPAEVKINDSSNANQEMKLDFTKLGPTLVLLSPKKAQSPEPKSNPKIVPAKPIGKPSGLSVTTNSALVVLSKLHQQSPVNKLSEDEEISRDDLAGEETRTNKRFYPPAQAFQLSQEGGRDTTEDEFVPQTSNQTDSPRYGEPVEDNRSRSIAKPNKNLDYDGKLESDGEGRPNVGPVSTYKPKLKFEPKGAFIDPWERKGTSIKEVGEARLESSPVEPKKPLNNSLLENPTYSSVLGSSLVRSNTKPFRDVPVPKSPTKDPEDDMQVSAVVSKAFKPNSILGILGIQKTERSYREPITRNSDPL